jgi:hypothetical protein
MQSALNEETVLGAVNKFFEKAQKDKALKGTNLNGSISRYSKNMIMSFPLLCDSTIPLDTAMMISKANERNITNMLQLLFASINLNFKEKQNVSGADIINSFYKDIDPNMDINDFIDLLDKISGVDNPATYYAKMATNEAVQDLMNKFRAEKTFKMDSINEKSLNDYTVNNVSGRTFVKEAISKSSSVMYGQDDDYYKANDLANKIRGQEHREEEDAKKNKGETYDQKTKDQLALNDLNKNRLAAVDVKKVNELEPTLMVINYNTLSNDGKSVIDRKSFLAGIKSRMVPMESIDIVERFVSKDRNKLSLKNLIRATTGEISFWKDFVLSLSKLKLDAKNASKRGPLAQYWAILEKRANKNNLRKLQRSGNDGAAITTIVVSQDTVNYMKNAYKFDLEVVANAKMIMDSYNLLGLIITDEATESIKSIYDGYNEFEVLAFSSLERDLSDKNYRKVINLINQVGR